MKMRNLRRKEKRQDRPSASTEREAKQRDPTGLGGTQTLPSFRHTDARLN